MLFFHEIDLCHNIFRSRLQF